MMTPVIFRLTVLAACCGLLISTVYSLSRDDIRENRRAFAVRQLVDVVGDPAAALVALDDHLYRVEKDDAPQGFVFETVTREGYNGKIELWLGVNKDNKITGVRVKSHQETPGIGDKIETGVSDWILSFNGKSLESPAVEDWMVKKDGGEFDQFTGATITARAVVAAVRQGLERARKQQGDWQVMDAREEEQ
ncbi:MAG: RnfABCDGE type electron transport complex subunit G [Pseudomonadales bacterium]